MTPEQIERVFGRGRLKMATGEHVEVFREAVARGDRRRYTKRFLNTREGDFGQWTEREWRILARLIGHGIACVPEVVQFDRGRQGGMQLVQTYDAGVTVDQWATLLPVSRDGRVRRHVFEDCAHWWALAHHCLLALKVIHALEVVHLDIKGDNVCIPYAPACFDPDSSELRLQPVFSQLALIDFAFALISRESLTSPLPIGWQHDYDYQSPRLLAALEAGRNGDLQQTRELDWRCDMYSLAAMLKRYLPEEAFEQQPSLAAGWTTEGYDAAKALILRIRDCHDGELPVERPHAALIDETGAWTREHAAALSLERGWTLAREANVSAASPSPLTPVTRLAPATRVASPMVTRSGRITAVTVIATASQSHVDSPRGISTPPGAVRLPSARTRGVIALIALGAALAYFAYREHAPGHDLQTLAESARAAAHRGAEMMRVLVKRNENDRDAFGAPAAAAPAATTEEPTAVGLPPAVANSAQSRQGASAVVATSTPDAASAPPTPSIESTRDPSATPRPQERTAQALPSLSAARKSATFAPPRPLPSVSQPANRALPAPSTKATVAADAQHRPSPQPRRAHAWWASLVPPAWLRTGNPPDPPGMKAQESRRQLAMSSTETSTSGSTSAAASAQRTEATPAQSGRASTPAAVTPAAAAGALPAADPRAAPDPPIAPAQAVTVMPSPRDDRTQAPQPTLRGGRSAVPIEDRSDALALALDRPATPRDPRERVAGAGARPLDDFAAQGRRTLLDTVPRIAARAQPEIARVLWMAAGAQHPSQEPALAAAARATRIADDALLGPRIAAPGEARRLNDEARAAYALRRNVPETFDLQLRAFGANPRDPEIAGNLASLYLRTVPPQPELARQVALFALAARGPQFHSARMEDWYTYAIASALAGREADATNALFVTLALSADVDRRCAAALSALAIHGARLRKPVEAMLYRVHALGRDSDAPSCGWPPGAAALSRLQ